MAATLAYAIDPGLADDGVYLVITMLGFLFVPSVNTSYTALTMQDPRADVHPRVRVRSAAVHPARRRRGPTGSPEARRGCGSSRGRGWRARASDWSSASSRPPDSEHWPTPVYVAAMAVAIGLCTLPPFVIERIKKPEWTIAHSDEVLFDVETEVEERRTTAPAAV